MSQIHRTQSQSLSQLQSQLAQRPLQAISTSINSLDTILNGGIIPGQIYEVYGLNNSGKPQLAEELCRNTRKIHRKVLWVSMMQARPPLKSDIGGQHIRLTNLGELYLFIQSLKSSYGLIVIEDFALAVNRAMGHLDEIITNPKLSIDSRRNKTILEFLKLLSIQCRKFASACVLFNPVDTLNMSFVQVDEGIEHRSSQSVGSERPKKFYQQILVSALGNHQSWSPLLRARIMLYKDWSQGGSTASFVHIRHNQAMKKMLQSQSVAPRVVSFYVKDNGLSETVETLERPEFTIDGKDLESEKEEETEEEHTVLPSSPCENDVQNDIRNDIQNDIQNAREMLSSQIDNDALAQQELESLLGDDLHDELNSDDSTAVITVEQDSAVTDKISETQDLGQTNHQDTVYDETTLKPGETTPQDAQEHTIPELTTENKTKTEPFHICEDIENLRSESMVEDTSMEVQEIDDELEELFPTQPEAISLLRLSQLQENIKRKTIIGSSRQTKQPRIAIMDLMSFQDSIEESHEENIPATLPFF
jgi:hypothetical protein